MRVIGACHLRYLILDIHTLFYPVLRGNARSGIHAPRAVSAFGFGVEVLELALGVVARTVGLVEVALLHAVPDTYGRR